MCVTQVKELSCPDDGSPPAAVLREARETAAFQTATDVFRRHMNDDTLQAFDAEFGGLPAVAYKPSQAT
ncbi:hypothetical protein OG302_42905 [Streptomyces sp. NBC_01283]|uniref:hypothetical protein n=1 Tax=Streptomyces sp. NBC_01283 TaxID=2903812 RepID=UPI00352BD273|nr:hypothetical protein OG302_42905 [Streptomyces sp. NBC_01283]